jgi:hypothetical protein
MDPHHSLLLFIFCSSDKPNNNKRWEIQITDLLIIQLCPLSYYLLSLISRRIINKKRESGSVTRLNTWTFQTLPCEYALKIIHTKWSSKQKFYIILKTPERFNLMSSHSCIISVNIISCIISVHVISCIISVHIISCIISVHIISCIISVHIISCIISVHVISCIISVHIISCIISVQVISCIISVHIIFGFFLWLHSLEICLIIRTNFNYSRNQFARRESERRTALCSVIQRS